MDLWLLALVLPLGSLLQYREPRLLGIGDRQRLQQRRREESRNDPPHRLPTRRTLLEIRRRHRSTQCEPPPACSAGTIAKFVFVNGHGLKSASSGPCRSCRAPASPCSALPTPQRPGYTRKKPGVRTSGPLTQTLPSRHRASTHGNSTRSHVPTDTGPTISFRIRPHHFQPASPTLISRSRTDPAPPHRCPWRRNAAGCR